MVTKLASEPFKFHETLTQVEDRLVREVLERVTGRWSLSVLRILAEVNGPLRFSRVLERVEGISQKVLTHTLRTLERDGLLTRTLYPQVPPRVEYELTPLGRELMGPVASLWRWIAGRLLDFESAQSQQRGV
jgi:DNA-binding HxlR family transcriptional regulator